MKRTERTLVLQGACLVLVACLPRDRDVGRERDKGDPPATESAASSKTATRAAASSSARASGTPGADPLIAGLFVDSFERPTLGRDWRTTNTAGWRVEDGRLCAQKAHNHPLWLTRRLPVNAQIEFDAESDSAEGDIKVELWGDGKSAATSASYTNATSYLAIFGGWKNTLHVLARLDEHGKDRHELRTSAQSGDVRAHPVVPGQSYHFKIERRDGQQVRWYVDDIEIHEFSDPEPLRGDGHDHFAFNNWEAHVCFDNLRIKALPE
jgi:Domain of unknown function (DUF6250)